MRYGSSAQRTQDAALALRGEYSSRFRAWGWVGPFVFPLSAHTPPSSPRIFTEVIAMAVVKVSKQ